jgi:hypothetical protein
MRAFERLDRSGGGLVVPFLLFGIGMLITVVACLAIRELDQRIDQQLREQQEQRDADTMVKQRELRIHVYT